MSKALRLVLLLWGLAPPAPAVAWAAPPTDIVHVDDYIGAPRVLFGRTGAEVERTLGPPLRAEAGAVSSYRDVAVFRSTRRLSYPGLVIDVLGGGSGDRRQPPHVPLFRRLPGNRALPPA